MEIIEIEAVLKEALEKPEDDSLQEKYGDAISGYLKDHKSSDELVTIVVKGIGIDRAANYFDYLESVSENALQSVWKQVRENKEIITNKDNNGLKFVSGLLGLSFLKIGNMESQGGNIISKLVAMVTDDKKPISVQTYSHILLDSFVNEVLTVKNYPEWESLEQPGEVLKRFAELLLEVSSEEQEEKYKCIIQWAKRGVRYAEKRIEIEKIEAKIPESKIDSLKAIVGHYEAVEKQLRDGVYEAAKLEGVIKQSQDEIDSLKAEKRSLQGEITSLNNDIEKLKKSLKEAEDEVKARTDINDAFTAIKYKDEEGILKDIAEELKLTYKQLKSSESTEMSAELGEIYREMLKRVFKSLDKKGIRME